MAVPWMPAFTQVVTCRAQASTLETDLGAKRLELQRLGHGRIAGHSGRQAQPVVALCQFSEFSRLASAQQLLLGDLAVESPARMRTMTCL